MQINKPFNLITIFFDLLIGTAIFFIVGFLSMMICIAITGSREDGIGITSYVGIPLINLTFYLFRRQHGIFLTILETIVSSVLTFGWLALITRYSDFIPDEQSSFIIFSSIPVVLTLIKHCLDKIIDLIGFKNF